MPSDPPPERSAHSSGWWWAAGAAIVIGTAARLWTPSDLWLDEALTVNIARLPLDRLPDALRHDGAPPVYYVLLHFWTKAFGSSDVAVRLLPGLFSVAALPLMWLAGRRLGGRTTAWWALILLACSPFAIRYATESRMYSLTIALALLGYLALTRALEEPSPRRLVPVALLTAALVLTHYSAFYLLFLVVTGLVLRIRRGKAVADTKRVLIAIGAGLVLFLPWTPIFLFQLRHTGTPWAGRPAPGAVVALLNEFGGGGGWVGPISALVLLALVALGLFGRNVGRAKVELDLRTRPEGRPLAWLSVGLVVLGVVVGTVTGNGFPGRYASMVLPFFILLAVLGLVAVGSRAAATGLLVVVAVAGLADGIEASVRQRTRAGKVAATLVARGQAGDVVAYCPDQLGPSVSRHLPPSRFDQLTFPRGTPPEFVDWVDYRKVNSAARVSQFGDALVERAAGKNLWVVWSPGYRTFKSKCEGLVRYVQGLRPGIQRPVIVSRRYWEHPGLVLFPAVP